MTTIGLLIALLILTFFTYALFSYLREESAQGIQKYLSDDVIQNLLEDAQAKDRSPEQQANHILRKYYRGDF